MALMKSIPVLIFLAVATTSSPLPSEPDLRGRNNGSSIQSQVKGSPTQPQFSSERGKEEERRADKHPEELYPDVDEYFDPGFGSGKISSRDRVRIRENYKHPSVPSIFVREPSSQIRRRRPGHTSDNPARDSPENLQLDAADYFDPDFLNGKIPSKDRIRTRENYKHPSVPSPSIFEPEAWSRIRQKFTGHSSTKPVRASPDELYLDDYFDPNLLNEKISSREPVRTRENYNHPSASSTFGREPSNHFLRRRPTNPSANPAKESPEVLHLDAADYEYFDPDFLNDKIPSKDRIRTREGNNHQNAAADVVFRRESSAGSRQRPRQPQRPDHPSAKPTGGRHEGEYGINYQGGTGDIQIHQHIHEYRFRG